MAIISRVYGWIQNPSDFSKLKKTVQIFDSESNHYQNLKNNLVSDLIYFDSLKENLQQKLNNNITEFSYLELVGTSRDKNNRAPKTRSDAVANGLVQISLLPQNYKTTGKRYTDNWTSDGFLRWAVSLGFLNTDRRKDTYSISEKGILFSRSKTHEEDISILRDAFLSYPPATRILGLLAEADEPKNKFYLGSRLGFQGERGFTSYNEKTMKKRLMSESNSTERTKIKSDVEGTSDKYARMISNWLIQVKFIKRCRVMIGDVTSFPGFEITELGKQALLESINDPNREKFLMWEFLAVEERNRNYVRTRRSYILKFLEKETTFEELIENLEKKGFYDDEEIIKNDIKGLINTGFRIDISDSNLKLLDKINNFDIPFVKISPEVDSLEKDRTQAFFLKNTNLDIRFIELLEIAFDPRRNLDFEIITTELIDEVYGIEALHLGGGRKPDGIAFTDHFGVIYDTKAYKNGYNRSISEADKMIRYVTDNQKRNPERNPTLWWDSFPESIEKESYYFLWISGKFGPGFSDQVYYVYDDSLCYGAAITVEALLLGADKVLKSELSIHEIPGYFKNKVIDIQ